MTLKFGSTAAKGTVSAGTVSGNSITYTYTITAGDNGLLAINTFTGGSITDSVGNAWTVTSASNTGNKITADTTAPVISGITNSSNGNWATSITLSWTITETGSGIQKVEFSPDGKTFSSLTESEWYGLTRTNQRQKVNGMV